MEKQETAAREYVLGNRARAGPEGRHWGQRRALDHKRFGVLSRGRLWNLAREVRAVGADGYASELDARAPIR